MENDEQALLHGFMEEGGDYELGDVSEEEEDEEDVHLPAENQDAGTQEGDLDQSGVDAEEALPRAHTEQFSTPVTESFAVSQQLNAGSTEPLVFPEFREVSGGVRVGLKYRTPGYGPSPYRRQGQSQPLQ